MQEMLEPIIRNLEAAGTNFSSSEGYDAVIKALDAANIPHGAGFGMSGGRKLAGGKETLVFHQIGGEGKEQIMARFEVKENS